MTQYVKLSDPVYDFIEQSVLATYPNACIVWIEKVVNEDLEKAYQAYKATVRPSNEKRLFHGTSEDIARVIIKDGFDPSKAKVCAHGLGIYFSTRAAYSSVYCRRNAGQDYAFMLVVDVITGRVGEGKAYTAIPPEFNSVTDSLKRPDMYVVNKREAAMPRYLVAFYPDMLN